MENNTSMSYMDHKPMILDELAQAKELLKQLESDLDAANSTAGNLLLPIILSSFEKSLSMLNGIKSATVNEPQTTGSGSVNGSPRSDSNSDLSENSYRKRKSVPRWTQQVRVCEQTGLEGPIEDAYSWRKYGQKDILGAIHPRGYYKCANKISQGCSAMKQVQRSDQDISIFNVTYRGRHTCIQAAHFHPGKSQNKPIDQQNEKRQKTSQEKIINFQTNDLGTTTQIVLRSPSFSFPSSSTTPIPCIEKESNNNDIFISSMTECMRTSESDSFSHEDLQTSDYDLCEFTSTVTSESDSIDFYFDLGFFDDL